MSARLGAEFVRFMRKKALEIDARNETHKKVDVDKQTLLRGLTKQMSLKQAAGGAPTVHREKLDINPKDIK